MILKEAIHKCVLGNRKLGNKFRLQRYVSKIKGMKGSYEGKRCFIIGNGPSLRAKDLDTLKKAGEICFASNRIYHIFGNTDWRPTFYCVQDYMLIKSSFQEIETIDADIKMLGIALEYKYPRIKNFIKLRIDRMKFYPEKPRFSEDISDRFFEGCTVTYMCIQIAVYLGFKEIILLGIDHSYGKEMKSDGTIVTNDGIKDHFSEDDKSDNLPLLYKSTLAYEMAYDYAKTHGIKIYNATRGGKLEVFERVPFDDIMGELDENKSGSSDET